MYTQYVDIHTLIVIINTIFYRLLLNKHAAADLCVCIYYTVRTRYEPPAVNII